MGTAEYVEICKQEIATLRDRLTNQYGPDTHILESVGNGPQREITEEIRENLRHTIRIYEQIVTSVEQGGP